MEQFKYESLESFENFYNDLCLANMKCMDKMCQKLHPRCFSGLCINYLQKNEACGDPNCKLYQYDQDQLRGEFDIESINGIYRFNICFQKKCSGKECQFLHVPWTKNICNDKKEICIENLFGKCYSKVEHESHISWKKLRDKVYNQYNINNLTPESLCLCSDPKCVNHLILNDVCPLFFKGVCPNLLCSKEHISWENFKINDSNFKGQKLQSCIHLNKQVILQYQPSQIFLQEIELLRLKKEVQERNKIDIIFILDCTGSMVDWIKQCADKIYTIIEEFRKIILQVFTIRIGFVGYRDYTKADSQDKRNIKHFECHDLTCDIKSVIEFISKITAQGGVDEAEDVYGGIKKAYEFKISENPETILITFLFADAPTHGIQYHDPEVEDHHKDDITQGTLEKLMRDYRKLKQRNFFYCVSMNETTDQMYKIMQDNFEGLTITQALYAEKLQGVVEFSLKTSLIKSQSIKINEEKKVIKIQASFQKARNIPYGELQTDKEKLTYWKSFSQEIKKNLRNRQAELIIQEERLQLSQNEGTTCYVYHFTDLTNKRQMIMKIPIKAIDEYSKNKFISKDTLKECQQFAYSRFDSLIIAKQLAMLYRAKSQAIIGAPPLYYVTPILYKLDDPFMGLTEIYAETYIDKPNIEWKKYSNNQFFADSEYYYLTSFSHFTYVETGHLLIVTDLQGIHNVLSDPSIQTNNNSLDGSNFNSIGMANFLFAQHNQCNIICQQLGISEEKQGLERSSFKQKQQDKVFYICDYCEDFQDITYAQYLSNEGFTYKCSTCEEEEKIQDEFQCRCCRNYFKTPYVLMQRIGTIVDKCTECKSKCYNSQNQCYYCEIKCNVKLQKFSGSSVYICSDARIYLAALQCQRCYTKYDFTTLIGQKLYINGCFLCQNCQIK